MTSGQKTDGTKGTRKKGRMTSSLVTSRTIGSIYSKSSTTSRGIVYTETDTTNEGIRTDSTVCSTTPSTDDMDEPSELSAVRVESTSA